MWNNPCKTVRKQKKLRFRQLTGQFRNRTSDVEMQ